MPTVTRKFVSDIDLNQLAPVGTRTGLRRLKACAALISIDGLLIIDRHRWRAYNG
jgi:hypothetical protein